MPHTPGPWDTRWPKFDSVIVDTKDRIIASVSFSDHADNECEANAHLISAAPDLLDACALFTDAAHDAVEALNAHGIACPSSIAFAAEQARHAIAKAEGTTGD